MTELQCAIACGACNSLDISGAGDSFSHAMLREKMVNIHFLSNKSDDTHLLHIKLFWGQEQKHKHLFEEGDSSVSKILEKLHPQKCKEIGIEPDSIHALILARKNKTKKIDISAPALWHHTKDDEANVKKAFALCVSDSSPCKTFNGTRGILTLNGLEQRCFEY